MFFENINYNKNYKRVEDDDDDSLLNFTDDDADILRNQLEQPLLKDKPDVDNDKRNGFVLNDFVNIEDEIRLYGVFVIAFDTRLGNIIEWQISDNDFNFSRMKPKTRMTYGNNDDSLNIADVYSFLYKIYNTFSIRFRSF
jgi:hypothetical protein